MSVNVTTDEISKGVRLTEITDGKFKTNSAVIRFITPLDSKTASANALAAQLLILSHKKYKGLTAMNDFTNRLYGASVGTTVFKVGDNQVIAFTASAIKNDYALEGESLFEDVLKVLLECIFDPDIENGFDENYFRIKKDELLSAIDSEINEKRTLAVINAAKLAFEGEPFSIPAYGTKETAQNLTAQDVLSAYKNLLSSASVEISLAGAGDFKKANALLRDCFANRGVNLNLHPFSSPSPVKNTPAEGSDSYEMNQLKMVMIFKTDYKNDSANGLFSALLGGTAFSKLFMNVREKLSLCYYCVCRPIYEKSAFMIDSGIDRENLEKARAEILKQIEDVKNGDFTDEEVYNTKLAMRGSFKSVYDSPADLAAWYFTRYARGKDGQSPDEAEKELFDVTREQIIEAAKSVKLDTVYTLMNIGGDE